MQGAVREKLIVHQPEGLLVDRGGASHYSQSEQSLLRSSECRLLREIISLLNCLRLLARDHVVMRSLAPCPSSPNCVSTQERGERHGIAPFRFQKSSEGAKEALKAVVGQLPRAKLVEETESYLHYEFTSLLLRFVDHVEFVFDDTTKTIHFRSASRTGYSDLGVNRRRMEEIRTLIEGKV